MSILRIETNLFDEKIGSSKVMQFTQNNIAGGEW